MADKSKTFVMVITTFPASPENFLAGDIRAWIVSNPGLGWELCDDPEQADLILFLEHHPPEDPLSLRVWLHPIRRKWGRKCWMFHDGDHVYPLMPGIYPGLNRRFFQKNRVESWFYVAQICENERIQYSPAAGDKPYLYSFAGACRTHPIRRQILKLSDERAYLKDTSHQNGWQLTGQELSDYQLDYAQVIANSKFVLCPRGISPTSYRLLEAMKTGRVPVILSDDWVLPCGPRWEDFVIVVKESAVLEIPNLLRSLEPEAAARGEAARKCWDEWCSEEFKYNKLLERFRLMAMSRAKFSNVPTGAAVLTSNSGLRLLWHSIRGRWPLARR